MRRGGLPLNALRAFEATMRHGQMGRAADELGVTHGAVSRQIRGLEDLLGVALFEGPRNRLVPSEAAQALQPVLTEAFDGIEAAVTRVRRGGGRGLQISCLGTLAMRWLIPRMGAFQTAHPQVDPRLTTDDGPVDFARHRIDVAIRVGRGPCAGAEVTELFADEIGPVLSPDLLPDAGAIAVSDLSGLTALHTGTRPAAWADWSAQNGADPPASGRVFEHFYFMLEAVVAGLGVAIAPEILVRDDLAQGRLVAPFGFAPSGSTYVALCPPGPSADASAFATWLGAVG